MKISLETMCYLWTFITAILKLCGIIQISWSFVFLPILLIFGLVGILTIIAFCITICFCISYACAKKISLKEGINEFKLKLKELEKELENNYDIGV